MARPRPLFQDHHVIEQQTLDNSPLLRNLADDGFFEMDAQRNRIFMPANKNLASALHLPPHSGGPIGTYQSGTLTWLDRFERSADGQKMLAGDPDAAQRLAAKVERLQDTMRTGLINSDLYTNAPLGLKADDIRPRVQSFFGNVPSYEQVHQAQISRFGQMLPSELAWSSITQSEMHVSRTLQVMAQASENLSKGGNPALERTVLSQAIAEAHANGRLNFSEQGILQVEQALGADAARPLRIPAGQRGFATPELLAGSLSAGQALRVTGLLASATDAIGTSQRVSTLLAQDNLLGAKQELRNYAANNASAWAGAWAGAEIGAFGGPVGAAVGGAVGGIAGYVVSGKVMATLDERAITHQVDSLGRQWSFNGRLWVQPMAADLRADAIDRPQQTTFSADFDTRRELDYRAANTSVELAMSRMPPPRSPYNLEASSTDLPSLLPANWTRDADTGQWQRTRVTDIDPNGGNTTQAEFAPAARAAQLDAQAAEVVESNIVQGPAALAARYQVAHRLDGWDTITGIQSPSAVTTALDTDNLQASNSKQYQFADGVWRHNGEVATGTIAAELSATRVAIQPHLQQHEQTMAALPAWQRPTQDQLDLSSLATTYAGYGLNPNVESLAAIQLAINTTRANSGLDASNSSLTLDPDAQGARQLDSPIAHLQRGSDGVIRVAAVTSSEDIQHAREQVQAHAQASPVPELGEQQIEHRSPQERDAYEQALREANRQGVSTQEAQQVASFAATTVTAPRVDGTQAPQAAIDVRRDRDVARTPDAPAVAETATPAPVVMPASASAPLQEDARPIAKPAEPKPEPVPQREPQETQPPVVAAPSTVSAVQPKAEATVPALASASAPSAGPASSASTSADQAPTQAAAPVSPASHEVEGLRLGDRGREVEFLQYRLQQLDARGPNGQAVPQDGHYGPETEHAVRQFQQDQGLPATGIAGQELDAALSQAQHARRVSLKPTEPTSANAAVEQGSEQQARLVTPQNDVPSSTSVQAEQQDAVRASSPAIPTQSEAPAQIVLPERTSSYALSPGFGGTTARSNAYEHDEGRVEQIRPSQDVAQQGFSSNHRDYALFSAIQAQLPKGTSDEKTAEVLHAVKESGIERADELRKVTVHDDVAFVFGKTPGFHSEVALNTPSPGIDETLRKTETLDQQRAQEMVQFQRQREEIDKNPSGPMMTLAVRSQHQAMSDASSGDGGGG
ncbi:peptidoglycan-binding domain-containing protein [Xanthomonas hortorum]|uniref:Peptidoglycan binding-like domain-containing protein n=1 Tax=Xanthomonas hortorum pv. gardneri TaxID=2754056 RepID=A0A6V7C0G3_9XANT|nr:peptidoglycan-binding domain-containing protein [Xanthomonas hortorum]MCC8497888.1 peptidoglycan-binding protein [Xanthomonas hortorum pv. gardneri]MCC8507487.1 peptidoglycan-binding protein [Xanthomonas hortorum pv. gardneri]MCC8513448.1 peptidoglycan-binding protein [Xanthomonas hortorum pv. gardneri]MCC8519750.1 peptidoglycan-binding protein [Xanthomonas hortorum pv. gardneri]MCC8526592.1 peptidoglycan-binding protein [Xanthomonas hortorum pv. gardneri]